MQMLFIGRALVQPYRRAADGIVTGIQRCVEIFKQEVPGRETVIRQGGTRPPDSASAPAPAWGEDPAQPSWLAAPVC